MDKKYRKEFELTDKPKQEALRDCLEQIQSWGLTMPDEPPIVRHFGLNDFRRIGEIEFWLANNKDQGYCSKFIFLFDGQTCPKHHHRIKHETFFVMKGRITMNKDGEDIRLNEGAVMEMPAGCEHAFTGAGPALVLEVSMPSIKGDSYFENKAIGVL